MSSDYPAVGALKADVFAFDFPLLCSFYPRPTGEYNWPKILCNKKKDYIFINKYNFNITKYYRYAYCYGLFEREENENRQQGIGAPLVQRP